MENPGYHTPVMLREIIEYLDPSNGDTVIDCTLGGGSHSAEILKRIVPDGRLIGLDQDDDAISAASERLSEYFGKITIVKGNFAQLNDIASELEINSVEGIIFDLGVSSFQLDTPERGFSFRNDAELDMRMSKDIKLTAEKLVNTYSESQLTDIIFKYGEDRWAKRIAKFIVENRTHRPIKTTKELVDIILAAVPVGARKDNIHPATKVFQALRISVNNEMESLEKGLNAAIKLLAKNGIICVLSYHSLEDRIVKDTFLQYTGKCTCPSALPICACGAVKSIDIITRRPLQPLDDEISANPRARSAKLRVARKLL
ncbi:MAG: 16S rRNA (cytosine(1402)-N(4))-methyltransferase RsmH [Armatimonadota bacterium]